MDLAIADGGLLPWVGGTIFAAILLFNLAALLAMMFWERSDPRTVVAWTLAFLFLPIVGFAFYLLIGQTFYARHTFRPKEVSDEAMARLSAAEDHAIDGWGDEDAARMARALKAVGAASYSANNGFRLYTRGDGMFRDLFADLRAAKRSICVECYIIRDDALGNEFMGILARKAAEGLEVRLLTDDFGFGKGPKRAVRELKRAGGRFALFHSVLTLALSPKKNNRNHRKIAVIDDEAGYCGGFNIGDEYVGKGRLGFWRDSAVRIEGGGVAALKLRFAMDWRYASGEEGYAADAESLRACILDRRHGGRMQLVSGGPDVLQNPVRMQYLEMFRCARRTLYLHTPYLLPDPSLSDALKLAAANGVDVRIVVPEKADHILVHWSSLSAADELMAAGVRVYLYRRGFVHSKTVVADGAYCSVGSANLDGRSMALNFETNAMIYSEELGAQMDAAFLEDLEGCREYSCEEHAACTLWMRAKVAVARLFRGFARGRLACGRGTTRRPRTRPAPTRRRGSGPARR